MRVIHIFVIHVRMSMLVRNRENDHRGLPDAVPTMESGTGLCLDGHGAGLHVRAGSGVQ